MTDVTEIPEGWTRHERPPSFFRRFVFANYAETRLFLDQLSTLSAETGYYPDIGFGNGYANVTIQARNGSSLAAEDVEFGNRVNGLSIGDAPSP